MAKNIKDSYKFVTNNNDETQCIGLTHDAGRFQGVIYKYGKVSVPDPEEMKTKSDLPLSFHYDIVDNNSLPKEFFNEDFNNLIGDILVDILDDQLQGGKVNFEENSIES
jgi:hypothetical protein|tara:strand:+ start:105 stop:431 length:327 start_codon:yes stop_codon:yes gene_type:complete